MKTKLLLFSLLLLGWGIFVRAQVSGYLGNKNLFSVNFGANFRFLSDQLWEFDQASNSFLRDRRLFRAAGMVEYARILRNGSILGLDTRFSHSRVTSFLKTSYSQDFDFNLGYSPSITISAESPQYRDITLRLKYTFRNSTSIAPIGLSHSLAMGPKFVSMNTRREYWHTASNASGPFTTPDGLKSSHMGFEMAYIGNFRYPVSNKLIFNFGAEARYSVIGNRRQSTSSIEALFSDTELGLAGAQYFGLLRNREVSNEIRRNWINVFAGFTMAF